MGDGGVFFMQYVAFGYIKNNGKSQNILHTEVYAYFSLTSLISLKLLIID